MLASVLAAKILQRKYALSYQHHKEDEIFSAALPYVFFPLAMISLSRLSL
jgi:hypothetical protein